MGNSRLNIWKKIFLANGETYIPCGNVYEQYPNSSPSEYLDDEKYLWKLGLIRVFDYEHNEINEIVASGHTVSCVIISPKILELDNLPQR